MRITKENLTRYDQHFKSWHRRRLGYGKALENWKQTEEAGAVQFYPVGGSPLEGKVKFSFTETPPVSGDKGPENPSTISGVSEVNVGRIGKNLLLRAVGTPSGYTIVRNDDGSLSISGSGVAMFAVTDSGPVTTGPHSSYRLNLNKQYTLSVELVSGSVSNASINLAQSSATQRVVSIPASGKASTTFTPSAVGYVDGRFVCRMLTGSSSVATNAVLKIQLEEGSTATDFEAPMLPADANHDLPLNGTYYGGEIDLATGLMTVTHGAIVLDGTEYWSEPAQLAEGIYRHGFTKTNGSIYSLGTNSSSSCSHFNYVYNANAQQISYYLGSYSAQRLMYVNMKTSYATADAQKAWLASEYQAGHPVVITGLLYTPLTVQLDPVTLTALAQTSRHEPRLNTVYTDADSIQITYQKSPIRAATEQEMAILGLGGNV